MPRRVFALLLIVIISICKTTYSQTYDMGLGYRRSFNSDWIGFNGSNMIRDSLGWPNPYLIGNLPSLNPKNLRYPAGGTANWWNWRTGWFLNRSDLPPGYQNLPVKVNTLENYKKSLDTTGANAILVMNMLTSTLKEQIAMLKHADSIGIKVNMVELGSEFYLDGGNDSVTVVTVYPTAQSYADSASRWADTIHKYFPLAKVAAQGAFNRNNASRRITWDENMFPTLHGEDAITYHAYMSSSEVDDSIETGTATFTTADLPDMFYRPFKMWNILTTEDFPLIPSGKEIWITEYNLRDHVKPVQGYWAQALFLATQTMQFLNDSRIKHLACHAMCGSAVAGAYFNTIHGFDFGGDGNFVPPPNPPGSTQYWGLTAGGRAMQQLGLAVKKMKYASPLSFKGAPMISAVDGGISVSYPALYGWAFVSDTSTQVIVVNLSANDININTTYVFPSGGSYTRYSADPMTLVAKEKDVSKKGVTALPATLAIKAYSIMRLYSSTAPAAPPTLNMVANGSTTFCNGDSVQLDAGATYLSYLWSTGATSKTIWAKAAGDYWVRVWNVLNGYYTADTIHVTVNMPADTPVISNIPLYSFCHGDSLSISVKFPDPTLTYNWSNGASGTSTFIHAGGSYTVTSTNANGCRSTSLPVTFTEFSLPQPVLTSSGPTSFCYDQSVTLDAGSQWKAYSWSTGKVGQTIDVTTAGSYTCTVKDFNNCYGTSPAVTVTVYTPDDPTVTLHGDTEFCIGDSVYLSTISGYSYQWTQGGVNIAGATQKNFYPNVDGAYRVVITDSHNCTKRSDVTNITVDPLPSPNITVNGGTVLCSGASTTLGCNNTFPTYLWSTGANTATISVSVAGNYTLTVTDANGCKGVSAPKNIVVNPNPTPTITASGLTDICDGSSVTLSVTSTYNSYNWSDGSHGQTKSFSATGSYSCTVTDGNGCTGTSNVIAVTVHTPADPTITVTGPTTFCDDGSLPCTLKTVSGYNYQWQKGSSNLSGATKKTYNPSATGSYKVIITDDYGCTKKSSSTSITVNKLPSTKITVTGGKNYCFGKIITLSAKIVLGCTYKWQLNGTNIFGASLSTYIVTSAGDYTYTATDLNGCSKTSAVTTITSNNCREENEDASLYVPDVSSLSLYPNPANDVLHIALHSGSTALNSFSLEIRNTLGQLMMERSYDSDDNDWSIDLHLNDDYINGVYFIIVKTQDGAFRKEFTVQKN